MKHLLFLIVFVTWDAYYYKADRLIYSTSKEYEFINMKKAQKFVKKAPKELFDTYLLGDLVKCKVRNFRIVEKEL